MSSEHKSGEDYKSQINRSIKGAVTGLSRRWKRALCFARGFDASLRQQKLGLPLV